MPRNGGGTASSVGTAVSAVSNRMALRAGRKPEACERGRWRRRAVTSAAVKPEELASTLHDGLAQTLTFALMQLDRATQSHMDGRDAALRHSRQLIKEALQATRAVIGGLQDAARPVPHAPLQLAQRCMALAAEVTRMTGTSIDVDCPAVTAALPAPVCDVLLCATRELLFNACKHAPGARVSLGLRQTASWPAGVMLVVSDDGPGFDPAVADTPLRGHSGLRALPARLAMVGARFWLDTGTDAGVRACISWSPDAAPMPIADLPREVELQ